MNWTRSCEYDELHKQAFHAAARTRLRRLAGLLGLAPASFDLRSNKAGVAVSGEITLHHEQVYVQVSQSSGGPGMGILIRTCRGRRDYTGGCNNFAHIELLDELPALANVIRRIAPEFQVKPSSASQRGREDHPAP